jgi:hypothetical protein
MPGMIPERKKRVLCSNLDDIRAMARKILKKNSMMSETYEVAADIIQHVIEAKAQALAMEKRLYLYKETIEGLGFVRKRKRYQK